MSDKPSLRSFYLNLRHQLSASYRQSASLAVTQKLLHHQALKSARTVAVFISKDPEINTLELIHELFLLNKNVCAPVVTKDSIVLKTFSCLDQCEPGLKQILQPNSLQPIVDPQTVDLFIIPGLSFDAKGYRLGYGKGYYDRLLVNVSGYKLGICFTDQLQFQLPHTSQDIPVNYVQTDTIALNCFPFPKN